MYGTLLLLHVLAATIWTGGHLVLSIVVLPKALQAESPKIVLDFEAGYERLGLPALLIQVTTGVWLAHRLLPDPMQWFDFDNPLALPIFLKLTLLAATLALAADARLRIIPSYPPPTCGRWLGTLCRSPSFRCCSWR